VFLSYATAAGRLGSGIKRSKPSRPLLVLPPEVRVSARCGSPYDPHYRNHGANRNKIILPRQGGGRLQKEDDGIISGVCCGGYAKPTEQKQDAKICAGGCAKDERSPLKMLMRAQVMVCGEKQRGDKHHP